MMAKLEGLVRLTEKIVTMKKMEETKETMPKRTRLKGIQDDVSQQARTNPR